MTTKIKASDIKGAIEVWRFRNNLATADNPFNTFHEGNRGFDYTGVQEQQDGIWLSHADLESYVTEREQKAFEAARKETVWGITYEDFEDFKKLTDGKNVNEENHE